MLLTSRGLYVPVPNVGGLALAAAAVVVIAAIALPVWLGRTSRLGQPLGERFTIQLSGVAAALALSLIHI